MSRRRLGFVLLANLLCATITRSAAAGVDAFYSFIDGIHGSTTTLPFYYEGLLFFISSTSGAITSVDLSTGSNGITGTYFQAWHASNNDGVYDQTSPIGTAYNQFPDDANFDSRLLSSAGSITSASESLGTALVVPLLGQQYGQLPVNTASIGYGKAGPDGYIKGNITDIAPGTTNLTVAYVLEGYSDIGYAFLTADVTTTQGTFHVVSPAYIPEPASASAIFLFASLMLRRSRTIFAA